MLEERVLTGSPPGIRAAFAYRLVSPRHNSYQSQTRFEGNSLMLDEFRIIFDCISFGFPDISVDGQGILVQEQGTRFGFRSPSSYLSHIIHSLCVSLEK